MARVKAMLLEMSKYISVSGSLTGTRAKLGLYFKITAQFETNNCPKMCGILKNVWESLVNVCGQP